MNKNKLSTEEWNALSSLTCNTKIDEILDVAESKKKKGTDVIYDYENDEELELKEGLEQIWDAIAYPLTHDVSRDDAEVLVRLFKRFGLPAPTI